MPAIAKHMQLRSGGEGAPPLLLELIAPPPPRRDVFPLTRQREALAEAGTSPLTHLVYAATWFSLSAFGAAIALARFRRRAPGRRG